ncbi:hypothetical protein ACIQUV_05355 [Streptomyces globosus]|uniref:hypothetical protein n=1 Tax=Streptomyces TaxID=1883 RepID=UPI0021AE4726|nr:hypothetical protein [Streptomyces sp. WAC05292]
MTVDSETGREAAGATPPVRQHLVLPDAVRRLSTLAEPDYADLFTLTLTDAAAGPAARSPEQWACAVLEDAAGWQGQFVWRGVLGLRLQGRPTPGCVAGWEIDGRGDDWIRLEAHSRMLTGQLVLRVDAGQASLSTFIRYRKPSGARVWARLTPLHHKLVPGLLREGHRILQDAAAAA